MSGEWLDLLPPQAADGGLRLFEGEVAVTVTDPTAGVEVTIPAFNADLTWDPAPWMPRGEDLPAKGDRCLVAFAETDDPGEPEVWVVAWWPYD